MTRLRPIHRTKGDPTPAIDHWLKWPLVVLLVLFVLALFWAREQAETLLLGLRLLEFGAALAVLLVAAYGGLVYQDQRRLAAREVAHAAAADDFWNPERLRQRVEALAEPYWRAVAAGDIGPLADCLSEDWRTYLAERLAAWRLNRARPVLLNSWEAVSFDITERNLLAMAKQGKRLGVVGLIAQLPRCMCRAKVANAAAPQWAAKA